MFPRGLILLLLAAIALLQPWPLPAADVPLKWRWSNPAPHGNNIIDIAYSPNLGLWVQVAERGQVHLSYDLELWVPQDSGTTKALRAVTFLGSRIIVTGESGTVFYANFEDEFIPGIIEPTSDWLEDVAAAPGRVVAVGDNGAVYLSNDGITWQRQSTPFTDWLRGVAYGSAGFVAVGENGRIATSPDGITWTPRASGTTAHLNRVAFSGGRYTIAGNQGVALSSSNGGLSWTFLITGASNDLYTVADANGTRVLAGDGEVRLQIGTGSWSDELASADPPPDWSYLSSLAQPNFLLLAGRTGIIAEGYRTNALTPYYWLEFDNSIRQWQFDVFASEDFYVSVGDHATILTSEQGIDWNLESIPDTATNSVLLGVGGNTNLLISVGNSGTLLISPNTFTNVAVTNISSSTTIVTNKTVSLFGVVWNAILPPPTTQDLQGVTAHNNLYVVTGGNGTILTSPNGTQWTPQSTPTTSFLSGITSFPGGLVACGDDGTLLFSTNAVHWSAQLSGTTEWIYRVRYVGNTLIAVGQNGTLLTSSNGINWTARIPNSSRWLNDVTFVDDTFFIVGTSGTVLTSHNLADWNPAGSITLKSLYGVTTDGDQLVTVGIEGIILRSQIIPNLSPVSILEYSRLSSLLPSPSVDNVYLFAGQPDQQFTLDFRDPSSTNGWQRGALLEFFDSSGTLFYQETFLGTNLPPIEYYRATLLP